MPVSLTHPGVFVQELSSPSRSIAAVATSVSAFIGRAARGPLDRPVRITSFGDFQRTFGTSDGALASSAELTLPSAVEHYFLNGGSEALVIRVAHTAAAAQIRLPAGDDALTLTAANPGAWSNTLQVSVGHPAINPPDSNLFSLTIRQPSPADAQQILSLETFPELTVQPGDARFVSTVLATDSHLVRVDGDVPGVRPDVAHDVVTDGAGDDGAAISASQVSAASLQADHKGIWALEHADLFNLLNIPPFTPTNDVDEATLAAAADYCRRRRAVLIVDPGLSWNDRTSAEAGVNAARAAIGSAAVNAALYFPRLRMQDRQQPGLIAEYAPGGAVAGIIARTDASRGVWTSPAGLEASFAGVHDFSVDVAIDDLAALNSLAVNTLRHVPVQGNVIWGARTLAGTDTLGSEWKYLAVRRTALLIEESVWRGTQWAVFEASDESLWERLRTGVQTFMHGLFKQSALQGSSMDDAFFVRCGHDTMSASDISAGIIHIHIGFAPLKPAEFIVLRIRHDVGEPTT